MEAINAEIEAVMQARPKKCRNHDDALTLVLQSQLPIAIPQLSIGMQPQPPISNQIRTVASEEKEDDGPKRLLRPHPVAMESNAWLTTSPAPPTAMALRATKETPSSSRISLRQPLSTLAPLGPTASRCSAKASFGC